MGETRENDVYDEELVDYEEEEEKAPDSVAAKANGEAAKKYISDLIYLFWIWIVIVLLFGCLESTRK